MPTTTNTNNGGSYTNVPLNMAYGVEGCNKSSGCPVRVYPDSTCTEPYEPTIQINNTKCCNPCDQQQVIYNVQPATDYYQGHDLAYQVLPYDCSDGVNVTSVQIPMTNFILYAGDGIYFDQLEYGVRINNGGVRTVNVEGNPGSGVIVTNRNTAQDPIFSISVNGNDLATQAGLVQKVIFNGVTYNPLQGTIIINSGNLGGALTNLSSSDNTLTITPTSIGSANVQAKPLKYNGINIPVGSDGALANFADGVNTRITLTSPNKIQVDVANNAFIKTVNSLVPDASGNVNVATASTIFFQAVKTLVSGEVTSLTGIGLNLLTVSPTAGTNPLSIIATDGLQLFLNGVFLDLTQYSRTASTIILTGVTPTVGQKLTWIVTKSS